MYSLVLMAALSPGADPAPVPAAAPAAVGCTGYTGCSGVVSSGCTGTGCYGSCFGCSGSCHGGLFARHAGLFGHRASCHGCSGSTGWGIVGGGCTGCAGCYGYSYSGWSCFGSGYGAVGRGSGMGMGYGGGPATSYWFADGVINYGFGTLQGTPWQCHGGCYGGYYGFGSVYGPPHGIPPAALYPYGTPAVYGSITNMNPPTMNLPPEPMKDEGKKDEGKKDGMGASIKFNLPADARLYVDGHLTTLTGTERVFSTPPLAPGKYYYEAKAVVVVDGKPVTEERRVIVEPGADVTESFATLIAAAARRGDAVAGK